MGLQIIPQIPIVKEATVLTHDLRYIGLWEIHLTEKVPGMLISLQGHEKNMVIDDIFYGKRSKPKATTKWDEFNTGKAE